MISFSPRTQEMIQKAQAGASGIKSTPQPNTKSTHIIQDAGSCNAKATYIINAKSIVMKTGSKFEKHESEICFNKGAELYFDDNVLCQDLDGIHYHACDLNAILDCC